MVPHYRSYGEQSLHYFDRPDEGLPPGPLPGPAAWRGDQMRDSGEWRVAFELSEIAELDRALTHARGTGRAMQELTPTDFPLPTLAPVLAGWRTTVAQGRGFLLVSGLPVERWGDDDTGLVFWGLGLHLGLPGAQNPQGDLIGHVTATGGERHDPLVRLYRTSAEIAFHCDAADAVGLVCLRAAPSGGRSRIASSVTVWNEVHARRPDLALRLFAPLPLDLRNEDRSGTLRWIPVPPCRFGGGRLRTFYHSDYFRSAVRHADAPPLSEAERELLDLYEEIASSHEVSLEMDLAPGDLQLLSNHTVIHGRSAYEDRAAAPRHLLRLWLSL